jgi:hypothetical protein
MDDRVLNILGEVTHLLVRDIREAIYTLKEIDKMVRKMADPYQLTKWGYLMEIYWTEILEDLDVTDKETAQLRLPLGEVQNG